MTQRHRQVVRDVRRGAARLVVERFLAPTVRLSQSLWQRVGRPADQRHILLYASNALMLEHMQDRMEPLRSDERLHFAVTRPIWAPRKLKAEIAVGCKQMEFSLVNPWLALLTRRDLIVLADYPSRRSKLWLACQVPRLFVGHYIQQGKSANGQDYRHREYASRVSGERFITVAFESSELSRRTVVEADPELEPVVKTVGYPRADKMLARQPERDAIRRKLGLDDTRTVVYVQSTWQVGSLMESHGSEIVAEMERLASSLGWIFYISTHPNHWRDPWAQRLPWGKYLREHESSSLRVLGPDELPDDYLVASDVVVTDHGSQAVMASLLDKPMLFFLSPERDLAVGSPVWRLREFLPKFSGASELQTGVEEALRSFDVERHREETADFLSYRGRAAERIREEMYALLDLSPRA